MKDVGDLIYIYDTTLRDGTQAEGISLTVEDKLKITSKMMNWAFIISKWAWCQNPKDLEYFKRVKNSLEEAKISAFSSTRRAGCRVEDDTNISPAGSWKPRLWPSSAKHDYHVTMALKTTLQENINMIKDTVCYLKRRQRSDL